MEQSIKRFLTVNALCMIALATILAVIAAFFLRQDQIKQHLDAELAIEAHSIDSFIVKRLSQKQIFRIQENINNITKERHTLKSKGLNKSDTVSELTKNIEFQVWDLATNKLILQSPNAPLIPLNNQLGYKTIPLKHKIWSTYAIESLQPGYKIMTMQRTDQRLGYAQQFVTDTLIILIITFIFLGVTIQMVIQRGLSALATTTNELKTHAPTNLSPLPLENTPYEIKPLVSEINRLMSQLDATLERERSFAANAAHTLKTPIAAMKAQLQMANRLPPESQEHVFNDIALCMDRYDHIIRQLLTLSKTLSENPTTNLSWVDLQLQLQHIIAPLVPLALDRNINIELANNDVPKVLTEPSLFATAITNLIDNAIKYTHEHDTVKIEVNTRNPFVTITIRDHGPGIPDDQMHKATQRFQRLNAKTRGSGLGLSIVEEVCTNLQATIAYQHTHPTGLTVVITLPINPNETPNDTSTND